ncbi:MAG TPA: DsbA family protein [Thermoplasmata archaeon]|nr:DsbA family protein [Thermoplasmata archaeon]
MAEHYTPPRLTLPVGARDHTQGASDAPTVLVEYGDYQCPYCGAAYPVVKRVQQELGDALLFVFRNFPITNAHPRAEWAAETAEAAAAQGKFWPMHDLLYEHQARLAEDAFFAQHEAKLSMDATRIAREVGERHYVARIEEDFMSGVRSGVNGTPTFFVNGRRYDGPPEFDALVAALRAEPSGPRRSK